MHPATNWLHAGVLDHTRCWWRVHYVTNWSHPHVEDILEVDHVTAAADELKMLKLPGLMKVHQVRSTAAEPYIEHRVLSCFCQESCNCLEPVKCWEKNAIGGNKPKTICNKTSGNEPKKCGKQLSCAAGSGTTDNVPIANWWCAAKWLWHCPRTWRSTNRLQLTHHRLSVYAPRYHLVKCAYSIILAVKLDFLGISGTVTIRLNHFCTGFNKIAVNSLCVQ